MRARSPARSSLDSPDNSEPAPSGFTGAARIIDAMTKATRCSTAAFTALLVLAGCSGSNDAAVKSTGTSVGPSQSSSGATPTTPVSATKVSANTATVAQLQQAFQAAGISGASRWAREVEEYRPYAGDPDFPKLRQELAKYNPGPGVVDRIVATLTLP